MNKTMILSLAAAGIALSPLTAIAGNDSEYPAYDFQPKVIFIDDAAAVTSVQQTVFDPKYPAASFEPKVIFIDKAAAQQPKKKAAFDPKYPATNFEPKVIFPAQ